MQSNSTDVHTADASLWEQEYRNGGIPSSVRARPSNALVSFLATVRVELPQAADALDIGCGTGRNTIYMAEQGYRVQAMDYCAPQVDVLRTIAATRPELHLALATGSVTERWPWEGESADFAVDAFCFKHQIEVGGPATYISELWRCLRPGGLFMLFLALRDDGYYRQFPAADQYGTGLIIVDQGNGIASRLYSREEIEALFHRFQVIQFEEKRAFNDMHGRLYERRSGIWYFRRT